MIEVFPSSSISTGVSATGKGRADLAARQNDVEKGAVEFEAVILAELLRAAGAGQPLSAFGGGIGEEQFASFLLDAQASAIAARGGIGLAEMVIRANLDPVATGGSDEQ